MICSSPASENTWIQRAAAYTEVQHTSLRRVLHPKLAEIVNRTSATRVLDYGCGDGRLLHLLNEDLEIDVYDQSPVMLELARHRAGARIARVFRTTSEIPQASYDAVVLSMVLVCIADEVEIDQVLSRCRQALRPGGVLIIGVTHPCFRTEPFSDFRASYAEGDPFWYLSDGTPFTVTIDDGTEFITFVDYHWSFSHLANSIVRNGLRLTQVIETPDDAQHPNCNPLVPPFLILTGTRHES
jgi:SAM-dependent methyltransferase